MLSELGGVVLSLLALAAATPFWQSPNHLHSSMARNIRHLPCVSRRTGESGTCMFAFSCAKLNGTHLGTCIDRFYFGSCCKVPEEPTNDLDVVPPIEDNSLDGTTTARIRPAVTQKPAFPTTSVQYTTPGFSTPRPSTQGLSSTFGLPTSTPGVASSSLRPSSSTFGSSSSNGTPVPSSPRPAVSSQQPPTTFVSSSSGSSFGTSPSLGSSTSFVSSSTPGPSSTLGGITPVVSISPGFGSTHGPVSSPGSTPSSTKPVSASTQSIPSFQQPTTAQPTLVTWTTIEQTTGKPSHISIRPQVSEVSGGTHRPTLISSTELPTSVITSTVALPISSVRPSVSSPQRPPASTHRPSTTRPPPTKPNNATRPVIVTKPSTALPPTKKPPVVTSSNKPVQSKPTTPKPAVTSSKPGGTRPTAKPPRPQVTSPTKPQKPPVNKPAAGGSKPKPTSKPKPQPAKPTTARPVTKPPTTASSTTTTTTTKPTTTTTTTETPTSETWVPISVSTHAPSTAGKPVLISSTLGPSSVGPSSSTPGPSTASGGPSTASVALPSVMSTSPPPVINSDGLNMTNFKDVCGRRLFPESRVVGGDKSTFGKWPWQISLRQWRTSTYLHKCGAALLNENWAITAAHCVENVPPSDLLLRLGEHDLSIEDEPFGYQERRVQIVASHPQFDPRTFEYDLALLRFYEPVVFQPNIIPICVPEDDTHFIGTTAFVTGWGRLYEDGPLPSVLQEVSVPVINNTLCETMYRAAGYIEHIPDIFICAGWKKGGFDSCEGDSGGPMVIQRPDKRWLLAGVISWGIGCAEPNQPGVYTRISQFRHWINQILQF